MLSEFIPQRQNVQQKTSHITLYDCNVADDSKLMCHVYDLPIPKPLQRSCTLKKQKKIKSKDPKKNRTKKSIFMLF